MKNGADDLVFCDFCKAEVPGILERIGTGKGDVSGPDYCLVEGVLEEQRVMKQRLMLIVKLKALAEFATEDAEAAHREADQLLSSWVGLKDPDIQDAYDAALKRERA